MDNAHLDAFLKHLQAKRLLLRVKEYQGSPPHLPRRKIWLLTSVSPEKTSHTKPLIQVVFSEFVTDVVKPIMTLDVTLGTILDFGKTKQHGEFFDQIWSEWSRNNLLGRNVTQEAIQVRLMQNPGRSDFSYQCPETLSLYSIQLMLSFGSLRALLVREIEGGWGEREVALSVLFKRFDGFLKELQSNWNTVTTQLKMIV
ncbi:MAG: hypothetical protein WCV85_05550 [Patescibacteria group bacterium]|jgi:hypothetical protein